MLPVIVGNQKITSSFNREWEIQSRKKAPHTLDKILNEKFYKITESSAKELITNIIGELSDKIMASDYVKILYGTRSLILLSSSLPEKWRNFCSNLSSTDIDIAVSDPSKLGNEMFDYLVKMATGNQFIVGDYAFYITRIFLAKKCEDLYTLSVEVRAKVGGEYFLGRDVSIMDISSLDKWPENTLYKITDTIFVQHPIHYICGLIDKLFNTRLNPRIEENNRESSVETTENKLKTLNFPEISDEDILLAQTFIKDNSDLLSSFKTKVSTSQATDTLFGILKGTCDFSIFDEWNNMYLLIVDKLVVSLSETLNVSPQIVCSLSFLDLLNYLVKSFDTLTEFVKYIKSMRGYRNLSYETENFIIVKFRYIDGFPIAWIKSAFYMRGSIVAINKVTRYIVLLKIGPSKGFESGHKTYTGETQDIKKGGAPLAVEQLLLKNMLTTNNNVPLNGELVMKVDGSLLCILQIPKNSIQYKVFVEILSQLLVGEIEESYAKFLLELDKEYLFLPLSQNTEIVKPTDGFFAAMVTAICGPFGQKIWDSQMNGSDLSRLMDIFQVNFSNVVMQLKEMTINNVDKISTIYYFEAVCANQTTLNGRKIPDLALSYKESDIYFLGLRQFSDTHIGPYLSASQFIHSFMMPLYWKVKSSHSINKMLDYLSYVLAGTKTEEEFLTKFPICQKHMYADKLHFEGFVLLLDNIGELALDDPLYVKLKSPIWYKLHKPGEDVNDIIKTINPKYWDLFPIIGITQNITNSKVNDLLVDFEQIVKMKIDNFLRGMTEETVSTWGTTLTCQTFNRMNYHKKAEKILIFTDIINVSVADVFGQFDKFVNSVNDGDNSEGKKYIQFFRAFLNPYTTKSRDSFVSELVIVLKRYSYV